MSENDDDYPENLRPEDGFLWIDNNYLKGGKKFKLDAATIVKKRIEYFKVFIFIYSRNLA